MLKMYGRSDDLVEIEGDHREELQACNPVDVLVGTLEAAPGEDACGLILRWEYGEVDDSACWSVRIGQVSESPLPWTVRCTFEGYPPKVEIDCPVGTPVKWRDVRGDQREPWQDVHAR